MSGSDCRDDIHFGGFGKQIELRSEPESVVRLPWRTAIDSVVGSLIDRV